MSKQNKCIHHLPATSIIELMVSAALIGMVLTALTLNMARTQRTLENTFLRSKATDLANSCMNYFRNARDNNEWPIFCTKMAATITSGDNITYTGSSMLPDLSPICKSYTDSVGNKYTYVMSASGRAGASDIANWCKGDRTNAYFNLSVQVKYKDAVGVDKSVAVTERFSRGQLDAEYK